MSVTDMAHQRVAELEEYLARQKIDVKTEQSHLDESSRECLYWHYGYLMALKDVLKQQAQPWPISPSLTDILGSERIQRARKRRK